MKLFKKLNQAGVAHFAALVVIVVALAAVGTYMLVASHADSITYSCPHGGTLSSTTCTYPATYNAGSTSTYASLCNSGDSSSTYNWNNSGGYHCAHLVATVGLYGSCPAGQYKSYSYCYTIYRPYCNSGDTISSDYGTCTHTVAAGYSCNAGGTLSGSTCSYAATATTTSGGGSTGGTTGGSTGGTTGTGQLSCNLNVPGVVKSGQTVNASVVLKNSATSGTANSTVTLTESGYVTSNTTTKTVSVPPNGSVTLAFNPVTTTKGKTGSINFSVSSSGCSASSATVVSR